jgi:hypothetical protein
MIYFSAKAVNLNIEAVMTLYVSKKGIRSVPARSPSVAPAYVAVSKKKS